MKKKLIALGVFLAAGLATVSVFVSERGISVGGVEFGGSERRWLAERTYDFLEDLKFKDFDTASTYHLGETQIKRDIPALIQRAFGIKHEVLDITKFKILEVDFDRSKTRVRVRATVWCRVLGDKKIADNKNSRRQIEMLFYWFRNSNSTPPTWTMELASSL